MRDGGHHFSREGGGCSSRGDAVHRWGMVDAVLHLREDTICQGRDDKLDDVVGTKNTLGNSLFNIIT